MIARAPPEHLLEALKEHIPSWWLDRPWKSVGVVPAENDVYPGAPIQAACRCGGRGMNSSSSHSLPSSTEVSFEVVELTSKEWRELINRTLCVSLYVWTGVCRWCQTVYWACSEGREIRADRCEKCGEIHFPAEECLTTE